MKRGPIQSRCGLTLTEVLVVLAFLVILAAMFAPALMEPKSRRSRINCVNCLKQLVVGYRVWATDHDDKFPMQVSVTNGGTFELIPTAEAIVHFLAISNEINTPRLLFCPQDEKKSEAYSFFTNISNVNLSYFISFDATEADPKMFLCGDRNLTNGLLPPNRILELKTNSVVGWTRELHDRVGNVGLADGSVQSYTTDRVRGAVTSQGAITNRLAIP